MCIHSLAALAVPFFLMRTALADIMHDGSSTCSDTEATTCGSVFIQRAGNVQHQGTVLMDDVVDELDQTDACNEDSWPDKDHGLVCGECKVLVDRFNSFYETCNGYCGKLGRQCVGAWEEENDDCNVKHAMTCDQALASSDAICQCGTDVVPPEQTEGDDCYGQLSNLAVDEGSEAGPQLHTTSPDDCKAACSSNDQCKSFTICPQWNGCWLKDRSFSGTEATREVDQCKTYYKRSCTGGTAPSPAATPSSPSPTVTPAHTGSSSVLKVMSYNTQYNNYASRVAGYGNKIKEVGAGVVGTQECQDMSALARLSGYEVVPDTGFQNPILYKADLVSYVVGSSGWMTIPRDNYADRTMTWAQFQVGSISFWHFNTHLPHNHGEASSRNTHARIAQMLLQKRRELSAENSPTVVTGDMNTFASSGASEGTFESNLIAAGFQKSYQARGNPGHGGLDQIFASAHWTSSNGADHGTGGSDHPAIVVDVTSMV